MERYIDAGITGCSRPTATQMHHWVPEPILISAKGISDSKIGQFFLHLFSSLHLYYR